MRSTSSITEIRGCVNGTAFLEGATGSLWYVNAAGSVTHLASSGVSEVQLGTDCGLVLFTTGELGVFRTHDKDYGSSTRFRIQGQFGLGHDEAPYAEIVHTGLTGVASIAGTESASFALMRNGDLYMAGSTTDFCRGGSSLSTMLLRESTPSPTYLRGVKMELDRTDPGFGEFRLVREGVARVAGGLGFALTANLDGTLTHIGSAMTELGVAPWYNENDPSSALVTMRLAKDRMVCVERDGTTWHLGARSAHGNSAPPVSYHFSYTQVWKKLDELLLDDIHLDENGGAIALTPNSRVLSCCTGVVSKFGAWSHSTFHLFENGQHGEQVALTHGASFIKQGVEWVSSYNDNPHAALTLRGETDQYCYTAMLHPEDWQHVSQMQSLGLVDNDAIKAALALV